MPARRRSRPVVVSILTLGMLIALAPVGHAGPPGKWTKVSAGSISLINQPGLYRTPDGVLHVAYKKGSGAYAHTAVKANGKIAGTIGTTMFSGWDALTEDPILISDGGTGLRLIFSGLKGVSGNYSTGQVYTATGNEAGTSWSLVSGALSNSTSAYASYGDGATTLSDGTPIVSFAPGTTSSAYWHQGIQPYTSPDPDQTMANGDCCVYNTAVVRDLATDDLWVAWYANGETKSTAGIFARQTTSGSKIKAPGSSVGSDALSPGQRVALAA